MPFDTCSWFRWQDSPAKAGPWCEQAGGTEAHSFSSHAPLFLAPPRLGVLSQSFRCHFICSAIQGLRAGTKWQFQSQDGVWIEMEFWHPLVIYKYSAQIKWQSWNCRENNLVAQGERGRMKPKLASPVLLLTAISGLPDCGICTSPECLMSLNGHCGF